MPSVRLLITGRVQGVGYRWFVREQARRLDLAGWVQNRADGTVELVASGPAERLEPFLAAVHRGPEGARVGSVDVLSDAEAGPAESPFAIHR